MVKSKQEQLIIDELEKLAPEHGVDIVDVELAGIDRPLRRPSDFQRFVGERCELTTIATEGRRRFKGAIMAADEDAVTLELEGEEPVRILYTDVKKCTLKPVIDFGRKEGK